MDAREEPLEGIVVSRDWGRGPIDATVRVLDTRGEVVGAGFVVGPGLIVTCAHVVTSAIGGDPEGSAPPAGAVTLDLPGADSAARAQAWVVRWWPIQPTGAGDLAILRAPTTTQAPPFYRPEQLWGRRFRVLGHPVDAPRGRLTEGELRAVQGTRWIQLQADPGAGQIAEGYSGSAVWDVERAAVVGVTVAADLSPDTTTAYLIPIEAVLALDPSLLPNPYRGLRPFDEDHADVFYGRDADVERLADAVAEHPVVFVVGKSGTGKSSLVRAGLLPRLRRAGVRVADYRPGAGTAPVDALAASLDALGADRPAVLFADQFEELTGDTAAEALHLLIDLVRAAARMPDGTPSIRAVLTLRWEPLNELLTEDVAETFDQATVALAPMGRGQLRSAVTGPAAWAPGLRFEPGLVDRILDDAAAEPSQLPLVSSLLAQLWQRRADGLLTGSAYAELGGVAGAVIRQAEAAIAAVGPNTPPNTPPETLRRLFTSLARPVDAGFVRQPVRYESLRPEQRPVVDHLVTGRLLVAGQQPDGTRAVQLAHQALIDHWPRLRSWLAEDREFLTWQRELQDRRRQWEESGRDGELLPRGQSLTVAKRWREDHAAELQPPDVEFVDLAAARDSGRRRRKRTLQSVLAMVLAGALVLGALFVYERQVSAEQEAVSASRELALRSADTAQTDPARSMMLALSAYQLGPTPEAQNALLRHYIDYGNSHTVLSGARGSVSDVQFSRDGRLIAANTFDGALTAWIRRPDEPVRVRQFEQQAPVGKFDVADDGSAIVLATDNRVWVSAMTPDGRDADVPVDASKVVSVQLGEGGLVALTLGHRKGGSWVHDRVQLWGPGEGKHRLLAETRTTFGVDGFGPDRMVVLSGTDDGERFPLDVWEPGKPVRRVLKDGGGSAVIDPAGQAVLCRESNSQPHYAIIDLRTGKERKRIPHDDPNCLMAPDAGGRMAVGRNLALDLTTGKSTEQSAFPTVGTTDTDLLVDGVFAEAGDFFSVASDSHQVVVTKVTRASQVRDVSYIALFPDGKNVLSFSDGGAKINVAAVNATKVTTSVDRESTRTSWPSEVDINTGSTLLADRVDVDRVQVRALPSLKLLTEIRTPPAPATVDEGSQSSQVQFHGDRVMTSVGARAQWWDPRTGRKVRELDLAAAGVLSPGDEVTLFPHGDPQRVAALVAGDPQLRVVDIDTGRQVSSIRVGGDVIAAKFQRGSPYLALLRRGRAVEIWDAEQGKLVTGPLRSIGGTDLASHQGLVTDFMPQRGVFLIGDHGWLRWYRAGAGTPFRELQLGTAPGAAGRQPMTASLDGRVIMFSDMLGQIATVPVDPDAWRKRLCELTGGREWGPEDRAGLPAGAGVQPLC